jgi:hypothetical protein
MTCTNSGSTSLYLVVTGTRDVQLGKETLRRVHFSTLVNDGASVRVPMEDGVLPTGLFRDIFISQAGHFVIFNPRRAPTR